MNPLPTQTLHRGNVANPALAARATAMMAPARPAFFLTVIFVFIVYARFPEIMDMVTGSAVHSVRAIMVLALLAILLFGGDLKAAFSKIGICLMAFTLWMCACVPFSTWRGGSVRMIRDVWGMAILSYIIVASAVQGIEQCRRIMYTLACATIFIEIFAMMMGRVQGGRMALLGGTLGNANYLALMLLMGLPFCLFVLRTRPGMTPLKFACLVMMLCIPITVAATGSRGGLVTLVFMFLMYYWPLPISQKVAVGIAALILTVVAATWATRSALDRFRMMFTTYSPVRLSESEQSALESATLRKELLMSSLQLTMSHPLFGVGPGMFAIANASYIETVTGKANFNAWHETHNTLTQLSCEDGLPGLLLYSMALLLCFKVAFTVQKHNLRDPAASEMVRHMAFALRLSLVAFFGTALFASNAYMYYFPMLAGLCIAVDRAGAAQAAIEKIALPEVPGPQYIVRNSRPAPLRAATARALNRPPAG